MARRKTPQPPRTAGFAWGPERVRLGLSLRDLARLSGVAAPYLSMAESGRLVPTGDQWQAVMDALRRAEQGASEAAS